eukprot:TRINITY_DN17415_c0_g1_i1.p2 TRINITY_DN17415_c0_g1~~TRINITY_DN17415_c0_g1_i1.p2  ORF type:complete len:119 (-),score=34.84 TRINITY_DN17415_c0_g1_i1:49-357(-)
MLKGRPIQCSGVAVFDAQFDDCPFPGDDFLESAGFHTDWIWPSMAVLVIYILFMRAMALLAEYLYERRMRPSYSLDARQPVLPRPFAASDVAHAASRDLVHV